jgi:hypothetical protein
MLNQISVFLDNVPGVLETFTKVLMENDINMRALTVAETADFGILRMLVDKEEECINILRDHNYLVSETEVIAVEIPDKPGALHKISKVLADEDINIEYIYSALVRDEAIIILRVDDNQTATKVLKDNDIKVIEKKIF